MKNIKSLIGITLWGFISILMFIIILLQLMKEHNVIYIFLLIIFLINSLLCLYISIYKLLNMKKKYLKREYLINKFEESKAVFKPGVRNAHILSFPFFLYLRGIVLSLVWHFLNKKLSMKL